MIPLRSDGRRAFILGAGFSYNAGLPLQSFFTRQMLAAREFQPGPSKDLVRYQLMFAEKTFGHSPRTDPTLWPELEDLFTSIDLSANTGHHLGPEYSPKKLRTIRRVILSRIVRMLGNSYDEAAKKRSGNWPQFQAFLSQVSLERHTFISLNWDCKRRSCSCLNCSALPSIAWRLMLLRDTPTVSAICGSTSSYWHV